MGPGRGVHGGADRGLRGRRRHHARAASPTRAITWSGWNKIPIPARRRKPAYDRSGEGCRRARQQSQERHRSIPLGTFTCITGRFGRRQIHAGSSKTPLYKSARGRPLNGAREHAAPTTRIEGLEFLDKVIDIDQSPIGRTPALESGDLHRRLHPDSRTGSPSCRNPRRAATRPDASRST